MNEQESIVKRLNFENLIWVAFIIVAMTDIYGDEQLKKDIVKHEHQAREKANDAFLIAILVSILIYIYFLVRNYYDYKKYPTKSYEVRLLGSIFLLAGSVCLLYFQITTTTKTDSPSNI